MTRLFSIVLCLAVCASLSAARESAVAFDQSKLAAISQHMQAAVEEKEIAGAVTLLVTSDQLVDCGAVGLADISKKTPMKTDSVFWIASMTKPVTGVAILMLLDEGKLSVDDPASKYLPELASMKLPDGQPGKTITLKHLLTHTAGLPENTSDETAAAKNLQDLVESFSKKPLKREPGTKWDYSQTGINSLGRIVEVVSGQSLPDFFAKRIFQPLGMKDTTFYPSKEQIERLASSYKLNKDTKALEPVDNFILAGRKIEESNRVPLANGGLYSTAADYGRFLQMLVNDGTVGGKQYLRPETVKLMRTIHTDDLTTGFTDGNGWGLSVCVVRKPQGVTSMLSPGTFGHGGAYGTQGWIDPERKLGFVLMVQRANFSNADNSNVRKAFQEAAVEAMKK